MNDTHLASHAEIVSTYTSLFTALANLIDRSRFIDAVEQLRSGRYIAVTQAIWDEAMRIATDHDNPGVHYIAASQVGAPFNYEAYAESVHALDAVKLGGFLMSWERAEKKFGGPIRINEAFRALRGGDLDRMVDDIYRLVDQAA